MADNDNYEPDYFGDRWEPTAAVPYAGYAPPKPASMPRANQPDAINAFNAYLRSQPWYQAFMRTVGNTTLSEAQRTQLAQAIEQDMGMPIPEGMVVHPSGGLTKPPMSEWKKWGLAGAYLGGPALAAELFGGGLPTLASRSIGTGLGTAPAAPSAASPVMGAGLTAATTGLPTLASHAIGNGLGYAPAAASAASPLMGAGANALGNTLGTVGNKLLDTATDKVPDWLESVIKTLAGVGTAIAANRPPEPSAEEKAFQAQATRLLRQQEQRTQFQNPLYEAVTRMAYGLQPNAANNNGSPYPLNSLDDVRIP